MSRPSRLAGNPSAEPLVAPPDRGRLMSATQVAEEVFNGCVSPLWVTRNLRAGRVKLGHVKRAWWEYDVRRWLQEERTQPQQAA